MQIVKKDPTNISDQVWYIKNFENDEYCIYSKKQANIVYALFGGDLFLKIYVEEQEHEHNIRGRWIFEKKVDKNGKAVYGLLNLEYRVKMRYGDNGEVFHCKDDKYNELKAEGKIKEGNDLW